MFTLTTQTMGKEERPPLLGELFIIYIAYTEWIISSQSRLYETEVLRVCRYASGALLEDAINNGDCCSRSGSGRQKAVVSDQSYLPSQGFKRLISQRGGPFWQGQVAYWSRLALHNLRGAALNKPHNKGRIKYCWDGQKDTAKQTWSDFRVESCMFMLIIL